MTKKSTKPSKEAKVKSNNSKKGETAKDLKEKIKNEEEKYLRLFAEFENYKKRTTKERILFTYKYCASKLNHKQQPND